MRQNNHHFDSHQRWPYMNHNQRCHGFFPPNFNKNLGPDCNYFCISESLRQLSQNRLCAYGCFLKWWYPKSSILIGISILNHINHPFLGIPIFGNTHMFPNGFASNHQSWKSPRILSPHGNAFRYRLPPVPKTSLRRYKHQG